MEEVNSIIKALRQSTGFSLQDCKIALQQADYSIEKATDILRRKYASKYSANTIMPEGASVLGVFRYSDGSFGYCQFKTQSDVVARSTELQDLIQTVFQILPSDLEEQEALRLIQCSDRFKADLDEVLIYFREPIDLVAARRRRLAENEVFANYCHTVYHERDNKSLQISKRAALVVLSTEILVSDEYRKHLTDLAISIAMTVVVSGRSDVVFSEDDVDPKVVEEFKNEKIEEARQSGKPEAAISKIVDGQLKKLYQEKVALYWNLLDASRCPWIEDTDLSIKEAILQTEQYLNVSIRIPFYKVINC